MDAVDDILRRRAENLAEQDSVLLNQAVLANRCGRHAEALALLQQLRHATLQRHARETRITALWRMGRLDEALALASMVLDGAPPGDEDGAELWGRVAACAGRIRLERGEPPGAIRRFVIEALAHGLSSPMLLALLRDIEPRTSPTASRFRLFVRGRLPLPGPAHRENLGYFVAYEVAAETPEQALEYVRELETAEIAANLRIDGADLRADPLAPHPADEPLGVLWRPGGRTVYGRDG